MQPSKYISYELTSSIQSNKQVNKEEHSAYIPRITAFTHTFDFFIFPMKNLELGCKSEFYHYTDKSLQGNVFTDAHIAYKRDRYELRLSFRNLFGNDQYHRRWQTTATDVFSIYHLRPREVFLDFSVAI